MEDVTGVSHTFNSLKQEIFEVKLQLQTMDQIIDQCKNHIKDQEAVFEHHLNDINSASLNFCDELDNFNDRFGIHSPWWHQMMLIIQDPEVALSVEERRQIVQDNEKMEKEVMNLQAEIVKMEEEQRKDEQIILALRELEEELRIQTAVKIHEESRFEVNEVTVTRRMDFSGDNILFKNMEMPLRNHTEKRPMNEEIHAYSHSHRDGGNDRDYAYEVMKIFKKTRVTYRNQQTFNKREIPQLDWIDKSENHQELSNEENFSISGNKHSLRESEFN